MNQTQFVAEVAAETGRSKAEVKEFLLAAEKVVTGTLKKGEPVTLTGFVKFSRKDVKARKARKGISPFNGEPMTFKAKPASKVPRVTPLKAFKEAVGSKRK